MNMKRLIIYSLFMTSVFSACVDVYRPEIEAVDNVMVVDARIVTGQGNNLVRIYNSRGYNDAEADFSGISVDKLLIVADDGNEITLHEREAGYYGFNGGLDPGHRYKLRIEYQGETFESSFEAVPKIPEIDTVYGRPVIKVVKAEGDNDVDAIMEKPGAQLYADVLNETESPYFRFTARKILQYTYQVEVPFMGATMIETWFGWYSYYPQEKFNIAAPPEYSGGTKILKHPLYFLEKKAVRAFDQSFAGWILILYQYGLSQSAYNYYKDLNSQLAAEGKLFDPVYVQARNNLKCTTDPEKLILGNFEISTVTETRYFVKYINDVVGYLIKPIPYFYYIPENGHDYTLPPDFWESESKEYPR